MPIDAHLVYWTGAFLNMVAVQLCALAGVRAIRRRDVHGHRRRVRVSVALVLLFVVSYAFKLIGLGRENLASWEPAMVWVLRVHELCVLVMVVSGAWALLLARRLRLVERFDAGFEGRISGAGLRRHRRAGWTALVAASAGLLTAAAVLWGMYRRAGVL